MSANMRMAVGSLALALLLALPGVAPAQQAGVGALVAEINGALAENPSPDGRFELQISPTGELVAHQRSGGQVIATWEMYFEDIESVTQTRAGHVHLNCAEDLGQCVKETCEGEFANYAGCTGRGARGGTRHSDVLIIEYSYDTRAMRRLQAAFDELLGYELSAVSAYGTLAGGR